MPVNAFVQGIIEPLAVVLSWLVNLFYWLPGSDLIVRYVQSSYQHDPFRVVLEALLVFFALKYVLSKKYKPNENPIEFTEKAIPLDGRKLRSSWMSGSLNPL